MRIESQCIYTYIFDKYHNDIILKATSMEISRLIMGFTFFASYSLQSCLEIRSWPWILNNINDQLQGFKPTLKLSQLVMKSSEDQSIPLDTAEKDSCSSEYNIHINPCLDPPVTISVKSCNNPKCKRQFEEISYRRIDILKPKPYLKTTVVKKTYAKLCYKKY